MGGSSGPTYSSPSGSGGGSSSGSGSGFGGGSGGVDECSFAFETDVFGPVAALVATLSVGDPLAIQMLGLSVGVFVVSPSLQQLGSVAGSTNIPRLVGCIQKGVVFGGEVVAINGSQVRIRISS